MKKTLSTLLVALLFLCALSGCAKKPEQSNAPLPAVTVILDYTVNTNHTGLYVAKELGYYEQAGLAVDIVEPAEGVTTALIAAGKGQFGIAYQEDVTYAVTGEQPMPIKAVAAIIQHNTSGFASHADKNIKSVKDFEGKVYAGWGSPSEEAIIDAVMTAADADFSKLTFITSDGAGYFGLADRYDLIWVYEAWDIVAAELDAVPLNYLPLRELDGRLDYYTPVIITNEDMMSNNPDQVRAFLEATRRGYEYAIAQPEEAAKLLHKYAPTYDLAMLTKSQQLLAGKYGEDAPAWGVMRDEVWDNYTSFMREYGLIEQSVPAADCYTNEFLPQD